MSIPENQVILITGCSSGIGKHLALSLNEMGHTVFATARKPETLKELKDKGMNTLRLDVCDMISVKSAIEEIINTSGRIDMLVNNAGFGLMGPMAELPIADLRMQFETNVIGPVALSQAVVPHMVKQKAGRIINVGSVSGITSTPYAGSYCGSKAAIHSISDSMRMELAPFGIEVVVVQPGGVQSSFGASAAKALERYQQDDSLYKKGSEGMQMRARMGQTDATPVEEFCQKMAEVICKKEVPSVFRYGHGSKLMPFLKSTLPTKTLDGLLSRKFKLEHLKG